MHVHCANIKMVTSLPLHWFLFVSSNNSLSNLQDERGNSVTIGIADEHIGLVVGRGGRNIMEISQVRDRNLICSFL